MKLLVQDKTGHSVLCDTEVDIDKEFASLCKQGYAAFLNDEHITELPAKDKRTAEMEVLVLAPIVGG